MPAPLPRTSWFSCPRPNVAAPGRLWCVPFAGGGTTPWFPYAQRLTGLELVALRPPGRESRLAELPLTDFTALAGATAQAMRPHLQPSDVVFGHSLGALVAFQVLRTFRMWGQPLPRALIVAGLRAPHLPRREPDLSQLDDEAFLQEIDERYGGLPPEVRSHPELRELALPPLRGDMAAYESYVYTPDAPLSLPIFALNSRDDPTVNTEEIAGWAQHTTGGFNSHVMPDGGHMFPMTRTPAVAEILADFVGRSSRGTADR